jgi:hypothetical protein
MHKPQKEAPVTTSSPFAIDKSESVPVENSPKVLPTQHEPNTSFNTRYAASVNESEPFPWGKLLIAIGIFVFIIILIFSSALEDANVDAGLTPVADPASGTILSGSTVYDGSEITIHAAGGESCVVKLKTRSGAERMSFYVRAGDTVTVKVPSEHLYVFFASGDTWYGKTDLFGEKTNYQMVETIKNFVDYTFEFTLYKVSNGNLTLKNIDADAF